MTPRERKSLDEIWDALEQKGFTVRFGSDDLGLVINGKEVSIRVSENDWRDEGDKAR